LLQTSQVSWSIIIIIIIIHEYYYGGAVALLLQDQCQCHVSQAKEQSQYLSTTVQQVHKTCPGVNLQGNTSIGLWVCAPVCVGHTGSPAKSAEAIDMPFEGGKLAWTKEPWGCYCRHLETISSAAAM